MLGMLGMLGMLERLGGIYLTRPSGTPVEILVMLEMLFFFVDDGPPPGQR